MINAAEIMTTAVVSVTADTPIVEAARLMLDSRISGLPVIAGGTLVGIVTEGDLLRRTESGTSSRRAGVLDFLLAPIPFAQEHARSHPLCVGEVMTKNVVSVNSDAPLEQVVSLMEQHGIKRVPVLEKGQLVGIVSRANLVGALANALRVSAVADRIAKGR